MKLITRDTDYALRALCYIGRCGKAAVVPAGELAKNLKIPRPFLRKLLQILTRRKFLVSFKGSGGGFSLCRDPERVSVADIMRIFQGRVSLNVCLTAKRACPERRLCVLREKIVQLQVYVENELRAVTLAELMGRAVNAG